MKRLLLVWVLCSLALTSASARGLYVTPSASLDVAVDNYLRGVSVCGQAFYDFGGIALGVEVKTDYDTLFNVINFPVTFLLGFGRDFWLGVGYTMPASAPEVIGANGISHPWAYGGFPNTYAMGVNVFRLPFPFGALLAQSEISYTLNTSTDLANTDSFGMLASFLYGLKGYIGVGLELGP